MKKILMAEDVYKIYNEHGLTPFTALKGINFIMEDHDFIAVMGPSGAGKSTFVNVMSSVDQASRGRVIFNDREVHELSEKEICKFRYENIGFVFQEFNLLNSLTIYENIIIPLVLKKVPKKQIKQKVKDIVQYLKVDEILDKYPSEISGGQKQRVAIARAVISDPDLLVADEPTGNLDVENSKEILTYFKRLNEEKGISILMVTHDGKIASYSSKFIYIRDGEILETLDQGDMSQKEYYYKIIDINNREM